MRVEAELANDPPEKVRDAMQMMLSSTHAWIEGTKRHRQLFRAGSYLVAKSTSVSGLLTLALAASLV